MFKSNIEKLRAQVGNNEGLLLVIAAEAFFALMDVSIKLLGTDISVLEVSSWTLQHLSIDTHRARQIVWVRMVGLYPILFVSWAHPRW